MKILLLHEMSGVHTELRDGLLKIGVNAKIATFGNLVRAYPTDIYIGREGKGATANLERLFLQLRNIKYFNQFDVIQTISPNPFYRPISALVEKLVLNQGKKYIYVAAGSDAIYRKNVRNLEYFPPHDWFERGNRYKKCCEFVANFSDIIPVCWEYKYCMQKAGFSTSDIVPFPVNINNHRIKHNLGRKIKFFHPINRDPDLPFDIKGTKIIKKVFEELENKYSKHAEFIMQGNLSHSDYSSLTDNVDVIVDQTYSYTYGMSAVYGMAKGKVVLSGMEPIARETGHYRDCPIINIKPDKLDIAQKIEMLIQNRLDIKRIAEESRSFAEKYHNHISVAKIFAEIYSKR